MADQPGTWVRFKDNDGNTGKRRVGKAGTVFQTVYDATGTNQAPSTPVKVWGTTIAHIPKTQVSGPPAPGKKEVPLMHPPKQKEKTGGGIWAAVGRMAQDSDTAKPATKPKPNNKSGGTFGWDPSKPPEKWIPGTQSNDKQSGMTSTSLRPGKLASAFTPQNQATLKPYQKAIFAPVDTAGVPKGSTLEYEASRPNTGIPNKQSITEAAKRISDPDLDPKVKQIIGHYAPNAKTAEEKVLAVQQNAALREKLGAYFLEKSDKIKDRLTERVVGNSLDDLKNPNHGGYATKMTSKEYASLMSISQLDGTYKEGSTGGDPIVRDRSGKVTAGQHRAAANELLQRVGVPAQTQTQIKSKIAATIDAQQQVLDDMKNGKISKQTGNQQLAKLGKELKHSQNLLNAVQEDWRIGDWEGDFKKPQPQAGQAASEVDELVKPVTNKGASLAVKLKGAGVSIKDTVLTTKAGGALAKAAPYLGKVLKVAGPVGVAATVATELVPVWGGRTYNEPITLPDGSRIVNKDGKWIDLPKSKETIAGGYKLQGIDKKTGKLIYEGKDGSLKIVDLNAEDSKDLTKTISAKSLSSSTNPAKLANQSGADTFFYDKDGKKHIGQLNFQSDGKVKLKGLGGAQTYRTFDNRQEVDAWLKTHQTKPTKPKTGVGGAASVSTSVALGNPASFANERRESFAGESKTNVKKPKPSQADSLFQQSGLKDVFDEIKGKKKEKPEPTGVGPSGGGLGSWAKKAVAVAAASEANTNKGGGAVSRAEREGLSIATRKIGLGGAANAKPATSTTAAIVGSGINGPAGRPGAAGPIPAIQRGAGPGGPGGAGVLPAGPPAPSAQHQDAEDKSGKGEKNDTEPHQVSGASTYFYGEGKKHIAQLAYMSNGETWLKGPGGQTYQKFKDRDAAQEWLLAHQQLSTEQSGAGPVVVAGSPASTTKPTKSPPQGEGWKPDGEGGFSRPLFYQGTQKGYQTWKNGEIETHGYGTWNDSAAQASPGIPPITGLADTAAEIAAKKRAEAVARAAAEKRQQEEARQRAAALAAAQSSSGDSGSGSSGSESGVQGSNTATTEDDLKTTKLGGKAPAGISGKVASTKTNHVTGVKTYLMDDGRIISHAPDGRPYLAGYDKNQVLVHQQQEQAKASTAALLSRGGSIGDWGAAATMAKEKPTSATPHKPGDVVAPSTGQSQPKYDYPQVDYATDIRDKAEILDDQPTTPTTSAPQEVASTYTPGGSINPDHEPIPKVDNPAWHANPSWGAPSKNAIAIAGLDASDVLEERPGKDGKTIFRMSDGTYQAYDPRRLETSGAGTWNKDQWDEYSAAHPVPPAAPEVTNPAALYSGNPDDNPMGAPATPTTPVTPTAVTDPFASNNPIQIFEPLKVGAPPTDILPTWDAGQNIPRRRINRGMY